MAGELAEIGAEDGMTDCFFASRGDCLTRADGQVDPAHLIPQQRLKAARVDDLWDERLVIPCCRRHHHMLDNGFFRLALTDYPPKFLAWAQQNGWFFADERTGWLKHSKPASAVACLGNAQRENSPENAS